MKSIFAFLLMIVLTVAGVVMTFSVTSCVIEMRREMRQR